MEWVLILFFLAGATTPDAIAPPTMVTIPGFASKDLCNAALAALATKFVVPLPAGAAHPVNFTICVETK